MDIPLILSKIFSFLSLNERLRMRLVCKDWYDFINRFEQKTKLCAYEEGRPNKLQWSTVDACVRDSIKINSSKMDFSKDPFLKGLKRLFVFKVHTSLLESLNSLTNLEELCIREFGRPPRAQKYEMNLNLPNLKTLAIRFSVIWETILDTPKLESLEIYDCEQMPLQIAHPDSIRSFNTNSPSYYSHLRFKFSNLRRLVLRYSYRFRDELREFDLERFPKLQRIELYPDPSLLKALTPDDFLGNKTVFGVVKRLEQQRSVLGRDDLLILVNGFSSDIDNSREIVSKSPLWVHIPAVELDLKVVWRDLDKMVGDYMLPVSFTFEDYQLLRQYCPAIQERRKFMDRFNLRVIKAEEILDPALFFEFLNEWGTFVEHVKLRNPGLFFSRYGHQLTKFQNISWLDITEYEVNPNYDFLLDLSCLEHIWLKTWRRFFTVELNNLVEILERKQNFRPMISLA